MNKGWNCKKKSDGRLVNGKDKVGCKMNNGEIDGSNRGI